MSYDAAYKELKKDDSVKNAKAKIAAKDL